jgi:hypothetical protein
MADQRWTPGEEITADKLNNGDGGLKVVAQSTPGLTLRVTAGVANVGGTVVKYAGGNTPTFTAPSTNPRIDIVTIDSTGTIAITQGTEAGSPSAPAYPSDKIVIAEVYLRTSTTAIRNTDSGSGGYIVRDARPLALVSQAAPAGFGSGADGVVNMDGTNTYSSFASKSGSTYTLTRDVFATSFTVAVGATLETAGYGVWATQTITIAGTARNNGQAGNDGSAPTAGTGGPGGNGGLGAPAGTFAGGINGGNGGAGANDGQAGNNATSPPATRNPSITGLTGANGGAGGANATGPGTASNGGTAVEEKAKLAAMISEKDALVSGSVVNHGNIYRLVGEQSGTFLSTGPGAGAGSGGGDGSAVGQGGYGGGGGGGGGGVLFFAAPIITISGTVQANGGNGGNGAPSLGANWGGSGGGGAGGSGGIVCLIYNTLTETGTVQANGGTGGTAGVNYPGTAGQNGPAGKVFKIKVGDTVAADEYGPQLAHQFTIAQATNPSNTQTHVITLGGNAITFTFVSGTPTNAGDVKIGATATDTATNLLALLQAPGTTNSNQAALSTEHQRLINQGRYSRSGTTITYQIFLPVSVAVTTTVGSAVITRGAGAGTGPTITCLSTDVGGTLTVLTGSTPATSDIITTLAFRNTNAQGTIVMWPGNSSAAALSGASQIHAAPNGNAIEVRSGSTALAATTTYIWHYIIIKT